MRHAILVMLATAGALLAAERLAAQEGPAEPPAAKEAAAETPSTEMLPAEHARLIGRWRAKWVEANGQRNPAVGDAANEIRFTPEQIHVGEQKLPYKLDTETTPKLIDITRPAGDSDTRAVEGIYEWEAEQLKICFYLNNEGVQRRPEEFKTEEGSGRIVLLLERID